MVSGIPAVRFRPTPKATSIQRPETGPSTRDSIGLVSRVAGTTEIRFSSWLDPGFKGPNGTGIRVVD